MEWIILVLVVAIAAYAIAAHRHGPEMQDLVHRIAGKPVNILFTPHLIPIDRGILSTIYVRPKLKDGDTVESVQSRLIEALRNAYEGQPFVHVVDHLPATKHVMMMNHVQMTVRGSGDKNAPGRAVIVCVIDNLSKGASSAAIQNMNVMFGLDPTMGL